MSLSRSSRIWPFAPLPSRLAPTWDRDEDRVGPVELRRGSRATDRWRGGVGRLPGRVLRRILNPFVDFGRVHFFARELAASPVRFRESALRIRPASSDEISRVLETSHPARRAATLRERFERGDQCFLAEDGAGRLVHSGWFTTTRGYIPELNLDVVLRPGEAYLYDAYTPPDRRGHGAFGLVLDFIFERLREAGFARAYSYVRGDDPLGVACAGRRLRPLGVLWYLRVVDRSLVGGRRVAELPL